MSEWKFKHRNVEQFTTPESSGQVASKAVMVSFGPPIFQPNKNSKAKCVMAGFVQNLNLMQQPMLQELFEIGSERMFWVDGPTRTQFSLSRVMYAGSSLLKLVGTGILNQGIQPDDVSFMDNSIFQGNDLNAAAAGKDRNFWINLGSDLFRNPLGIMLDFREYFSNGKSTSYGSVYLTNGKIQSHQLNVTAGQWMVQESASFQFEKVIPLSKPGSTFKESYEKRKEIMDNLNMTPEWFDQYKNWTGTVS